MHILMIGPKENNSTDGVIIKGIKRLFERAYGKFTFSYRELRDHTEQRDSDFLVGEAFDLVAVCGTPWLWDSFQNSFKYRNALRCFELHPEAGKLFMGAGACLNLVDITSDILERPSEVQGMQIFRQATVIVRDPLAHYKLKKAGVVSYLLPCPAFFATGPAITPQKTSNVLIWQDPTQSISGESWKNTKALSDWADEVLEFIEEKQPEIYCARPDDMPMAERLGFKPVVLNTADETLDAVNTVGEVLSGRVHCAVPALAQGASVKLKPFDSRMLTLEAFRRSWSNAEHADAYQTVLQGLVHDGHTGVATRRGADRHS